MRFRPLLAACFALTACATEGTFEPAHEPEDFIVDPEDGKADGVPPIFDPDHVVGDILLTTPEAMRANDVQLFFEQTPYNRRSWLASYEEDGQRAADIVVDVAVTHGINPLVLIARIQVETALVSKTTRPSQDLIDRALGCTTSQPGLRAQLDCAARMLAFGFDASYRGTGEWRKLYPHDTLDGIRVTPANHATASFYASKPWVRAGDGGNWLVWNMVRKYVRSAEARGLFYVPPERS